MDGVSIAASIIGIATAGVQVSIKLVTLATQISTASDRVSAIGNDISLTAGVLRQLGDLMAQETKDGSVSILNPEGLETTRTAAAMCERIFSEIEKEVKRASEQLRRYKPGLGKMRGQKIELSKTEKAKWPFMQPRIDDLRGDLRDAKSTLILLLQVATLALNKRMADVSASEDQDLIRAVVALELDRRIKPPEVSSSSGSIKSTNIGIPNTTSPKRKPDVFHYLSSSLAQAGRKSIIESTASRESFPASQEKGPLDSIASPEDSQSRGLISDDFSDFSVANSPGLNIPPTIEHKRFRTLAPGYSPAPSENGNQPQISHNSELQLFLLKPIVNDLYDRIELRWTVQDTNMQPLAIREYMDKNEKDEIPSVVEMLEQLHAYEQELVESETPKDSGRSILSLKRTRIDIRSRDMLFQSVPGLWFVVQCRVRQSLPQGEGLFQNTIPRISGRPALLYPSSGERARYSSHPTPFSRDQTAGVELRRIVSEGKDEPIILQGSLRPASTLFKMAGDPPVEDSWDEATADGEEVDTKETEVGEDVKEEAQAEAMVNDLLKQYTTLSIHETMLPATRYKP